MTITKDAVLNYLKDFEDNQIFDFWGEFCEANSYYDDVIYAMLELDNVLGDKTPTQVLDLVNYEFNTNDDYFNIDGCGYLNSFNYLSDSPVDMSALADWLIQSNHYVLADLADEEETIEDEEIEEDEDND